MKPTGVSRKWYLGITTSSRWSVLLCSCVEERLRGAVAGLDSSGPENSYHKSSVLHTKVENSCTSVFSQQLTGMAVRLKNREATALLSKRGSTAAVHQNSNTACVDYASFRVARTSHKYEPCNTPSRNTNEADVYQTLPDNAKNSGIRVPSLHFTVLQNQVGGINR